MQQKYWMLISNMIRILMCVHYMYKYVCVLCACEEGADIHIKRQATQHDCLSRLLGVGDTVKSVR
jgi:hypothetical protein